MSFSSAARTRTIPTAAVVCVFAPAPAFFRTEQQSSEGGPCSRLPAHKGRCCRLPDRLHPDHAARSSPAVRLPGIYGDVATPRVSQATGFTAAFGGSTAHSRTLAANEKVYVTQITVKRGAVLMELLTVDVTTLADGQGTRYRAEVNVKLPGLDSMTPEDVKKTIDTVIADPATTSAVESKIIKPGMSLDEVKKSLANPDKIVDLGAKTDFRLQRHESAG